MWYNINTRLPQLRAVGANRIKRNYIWEVINMINLIIGKKGTGKTKRIIKLAQDALLQATGQVVFLDDDKRCMSELNYKIRFINTTEFALSTADDLYGFIAGMIAGNFDTQKVFVDGLYSITDLTDDTIEAFLAKLDTLCAKNDVDVYINVSTVSDNLTEASKKYIFEELTTPEA